MKTTKAKLGVFKSSILTLVLVIFQATLSSAQVSQREQESTWTKVIELADGLIGEGGVVDAQGAEGKIDALVDLHAQFLRGVLGKPVPSQRVMLVKQGFRLFLKTGPKRYGGDKRQAMLRLLRDLAANRAVFVELLSADSPAEVIEQQLLGYLERNQNLSYKEPVPVSGQLRIPSGNTPLRIVADAIRLVGDQGTSGHYNRAIDAGEIITLNIPLKNFADHPFRSTSAILETDDPYVRANVSKVTYTERSVVGGETITFGPGAVITPKQHFGFTIVPNCPDGHEVAFNLHVGDSDYGQFNIPLTVIVYNVGPLDFGQVKIDDDRFGDSDGNGNGLIEPGETIEYVLSLKNCGKVDVRDITATIFSPEAKIRFKPGGEILRYKGVSALDQQGIPASFIFSVDTPNASVFAKTLVDETVQLPRKRSPLEAPYTYTSSCAWADKTGQSHALRISLMEIYKILEVQDAEYWYYSVTMERDGEKLLDEQVAWRLTHRSSWDSAGKNPCTLDLPDIHAEVDVQLGKAAVRVNQLSAAVPFRLLATGTARDHPYSWLSTRFHWIGRELAGDFEGMLAEGKQLGKVGRLKEAISKVREASALPGYAQDRRTTEALWGICFDHQDETFIDRRTGLMWQKTAGGRVKPKRAQQIVDALNVQKFAGFSDWRLPTGAELLGLYESLGGPIPERNRATKFSDNDPGGFNFHGSDRADAVPARYDGHLVSGDWYKCVWFDGREGMDDWITELPDASVRAVRSPQP